MGLELHLISREIDDPVGDVIFVHGIGGDAHSTWTSSSASVGRGDTKQPIVSNFPSVISADFPSIRFWSLDYTANISEWQEGDIKFNELPRHCAQILEFLRATKIGDRPLIFVCHSLGGIVIKEVLRISQNSRFARLKDVWKMTKAVSFIATPHKGSNVANILTAIDRVLPFIRTSSRVTEISHDNVYLESLSAWYREKAEPDQIETQAFYEQRKMSGVFIVPHYSANPDVIGCTPIGINENHIDISKPVKKTDLVYASIAGLIGYHLLKLNTQRTLQNSIPPQTVVIGAVMKGDKVLMVRRRNPVGGLTWQFVAGRLRVSEETAEECIVREVREEAGVDARVVATLGEGESSGIPYRLVYLGLAYLGGKAHNADPVENSSVRWVKASLVHTFATTPVHPAIDSFIRKTML